MLAAMLAGVLAFASLGQRHYDPLPSVSFHNELLNAKKDGRDGVVVAFVDNLAEDYDTVEMAFNAAAAFAGCIAQAHGGIHMLQAGEDDRARFIATNFRADYSLPQRPTLPFAAFFRNTQPVSVHDGNWTAGSLESWLLANFNITHVKTGDDLELLEAHTTHYVMAIFDDHCSEDAFGLYNASVKLRESGSNLPVVFSSNMTLADLIMPGVGAQTGIYAVRGGASRVRYPNHVLPGANDAGRIAEWIAGTMGTGESRSQKDEV